MSMRFAFRTDKVDLHFQHESFFLRKKVGKKHIKI